MSYSEPLANQIYRFVLALGFGVILGVIYELLVLIRTLISEKRWAVITQDITFAILSAFLSFLFMLVYNEGIVRLNLIFASFLSLFAFHRVCSGKIIYPFRVFIRKIKGRLRKKEKNK